jgi:outer membrane protein assembly factor BamE
MLKKLLIFALLLNHSAWIYKMDIYQGKVVDADQVEKLTLGMSRRSGMELLGSPQILDPFHTQRWDYYSMAKTRNQSRTSQFILTLMFEDDRLAEIILPEKPIVPQEKLNF